MSMARVLPGIDTPARIVGTCGMGAAVEAAILWRFAWTPPLAAYVSFGAAATVASATDLATQRIPNRVVLPGLVAGGVLLALASAMSGAWWPLARAGIALVVLAGFYLALGLAFPSGMGMGDCKWAGTVGLYLGWLGWSALSTGALLTFLAAALFVTGRRVVSSPSPRMLLPFAPFMAGGALVAVLAIR